MTRLCLTTKYKQSFVEKLTLFFSTVKRSFNSDNHRQHKNNSANIFINILDSIDADVYVADLSDYTILFANRHMCDDFGDHLVGKICYQAFRNEKQPCPHCTNGKLLTAKGFPAGVFIWEGKNPITGRWYKNSDRAIMWDQGKYVRLQVATDITELKNAEKRLAHMALSDPLTDLPNRIHFERDLEMAIKDAKNNRSKTAILFLDLDKFKSVNDRYGHNVGDLLLQKLTRRLQGCLRESDMVARASGDEFTFILRNIPDDKTIDKISQRIIAAVSTPFKINGIKIVISGSLGISIYPEDGENADHLLQNADQAMYQCKKNNGNMFLFYHQMQPQNKN